MLQEGAPALLYAPNFVELRYGEVQHSPGPDGTGGSPAE